MGTECCRVKKDNSDKTCKPEDENRKKTDENGKKTENGAQESDAFAEPIFPPALMKYPILPLRLVGDKVTWYRPLTLPSLLQLKLDHPHAKLVVGNTEIGIEMKFKNAVYPVIISPTHVPELCGIVVGESGVEVGASVTINDLRAALEV
jgi:xanthine dehydrogenase/oxidase